MTQTSFDPRRLLAWAVHLYTASGLAVAFAIGVCIVRGTPSDLAWAFGWMVVATIIDATDGWMARTVGVKEILPEFDGRRLDDIIDFLNYTFLPLLLIWRARLLPESWTAFLLIPLLASVYGFCQQDAKTADGYFLGFPSYWNVVALYLYYLESSVVAVLVTTGVLSVLTFVPTRYLYPSQHGTLNRLTCVLGAVWALGLLAFLAGHLNPDTVPDPRWLIVSLAFPLFYMGASWFVELNERRRG